MNPGEFIHAIRYGAREPAIEGALENAGLTITIDTGRPTGC